MRKLVGVFGGTFDPIHNGHLHSAIELQQRLGLDELRLIPCHQPPHRETPGCSAEQRLAMVKLAVTGNPGLRVDDRELKRDGYSYTVDTLQELRDELGSEVALCLVMGTDAFAKLDSWHQWQRILDLAHIVVMARPAEALPDTGPIATLVEQHRLTAVAQLPEQPAGGLWFEALTPYPVSATAVRAMLARDEEPLVDVLQKQTLHEQQSLENSVPQAVLEYIEKHHLYR